MKRTFLNSRLSMPCMMLIFYALITSAHSAPQDTAPVPEATRLEMVVLGSGGPGATGRAGSSFLILLDHVPRILVDAGPGSFARLGESGLSIAATDIVLLTHLHIDHVGELPGLFKARAVSSRGDINFRVFGPEGHRGKKGEATFPSTSQLIHLLFDKDGSFGYLRDFSAPMTITSRDLKTALQPGQKPHTILSEGDLKISAIAGHHRDAPAVIYRIDYAGKSITFSGDIDAQGLPDLREIARGTDLLVFNTVVLDPPGSPNILYTLHTPPKAIGELAEGAQVRKLLLTHLSPAVEQSRSDVEASIRSAYQGPLVFAVDGLSVSP
jgi:ribonuclease BN (tRNA processing enzyme)